MSIRVRYPLTIASILIVILQLILIDGCASQPRATPTPTKTPRVEAPPTTSVPQATVAPPTVVPTNTPAPVATSTPAPTDTPAAADIPAPAQGSTPASGDPAASAQGPGSNISVSAALPSRDPNVSPFTGLRPADPAALARRPLAIKVDNDPAVVPQSGLDKADVVVESKKEGCKTRFTAIYQTQDAARVGSMRSARLIDIELPVIFDAVLGFSGAVEPVRQKIIKSDIGDHILGQGPAFFRDPKIPVPFNLFANTATVWKVVAQRGWNKAPKPTAAWAFSESAPAGSASAKQLDVPYPEQKVRWAYNAGSGRWSRFIGGKPHIDKVTGQQLTAANVVVLSANHVQTLIPEQGTKLTRGPCSNASIEIQLWGEGPLKILRDGKVYQGKWLRPERHAPFRFVDASGKDIPLKPGNSWWQVVPLDMKVTVSP